MGGLKWVSLYSQNSVAKHNLLAEHIDRQQFPGALPEDVDSGDWRTRWTNLKHIYKTLTTFLVEDCHQKLPLACGSPDLKEIAQSTSIADMNRLLELVFVAAITCNNCNSYLMGVQELPPSTLEILVPIAQQAGPSQDSESSQGEHEEHEEQGRGLDQEEHRKEKDTNKTKESESTKYGSIRRPGGQRIGSDSELAFEQSVGQVIADKNAVLEQKSELQRQLDDMYDRHTKLQQSHDIVQDQLKEVNDRLKTVLAGKNQPSTPAIQLKHEAKIATLEDKLASTEEQLEHAMRANEVLRIKNEKTQRLQDEYDELKIETSKLSRRANAADKYKQKLEASLNLEKENQDLREQIKDFGKHLKDSDSNRLLSSDLKRENEEYRRVLPGIEQERHELNEMKKRIEFDYLTLEARWQASEEQNTRQKAAIEELQSRLKDYEEGHSPSTPPTGGNRKDLSDYDEQLVQDESREFTTVDVGDQNYISEAELRLIMSAMQAQGRDAASSGNFSGIEVEKKLAEKIERNRDTFKQLIEVIDFLAQPRVQFVGVKNLDEQQPFKPVLRHINDDSGSIYPSENGSITSLARSSNLSLAIPNPLVRISSTAILQSGKDVAAARRASRFPFKGIFGGK